MKKKHEKKLEKEKKNKKNKKIKKISNKCTRCKIPQLVPYKCEICNKVVCMKHRFSDQHRCEKPKSRLIRNNISSNTKKGMFDLVDDIRNYIFAY